MLQETQSREHSMKTMTMTGALLVFVLTAGCSRNDDGVGPAQKAGKAVDEAGDKLAQGLRAPLEKADEAAKKLAQRAEEERRQIAERTEEAREKIKDATEEAGRGLEKAAGKVGEKVERAGEKMQEAAR
jgi:methyl-accepting chemotaxis protein